MMGGEEGFGRVGILGLGLIGGSVAAALKQRGLAEIVAWDASEKSLELGLTRGIVDSVASGPGDLGDCDIIVLAVPVLAMKAVLSEVSPGEGILTDVGSVKGHVVEAVREVFGTLPAGFVPGHPIAGSERHGVRAANPNLFEKHRVILTPVAETAESARLTVARLWSELGAEVLSMTPAHHDSVLAQTSHLPHLLAYGLVDTLSSGGDSLEVFQYAAGGFRDFSRIAASDPVMWRDIFLANQAPVLEFLDAYLDELVALRKSLADGDGEQLATVFTRAKAARDHFSDLDKKRRSE